MTVNDSILTSIKKLLGIDEGYNAFDTDIIIHINSVFMHLNQLGVGPEQPFSITGDSETWADFLGDKVTEFEAVKTFIYIKVRLIFDPPTNSFVVDAYDKTAKEYEWRLIVQAERGLKLDEVNL